jgi:hypothetical protein
MKLMTPDYATKFENKMRALGELWSIGVVEWWAPTILI